MKNFIRKLLLKEKADSETLIAYLRSRGMRIGEDVVIYAPGKVEIDVTRPWLIEIGDNVKITKGVTILTHGYDWSVIKVKHGKILGSSGKVTIGNNVFIGMNTTILKGVTVGNNVIIGANSLVNKDIPDNSVVAGNPARVITNVDDYMKKRESKQLDEAVECAKEYYKVYNKWPSEKDMREFIWLFGERNSNIEKDEVFKEIGSLCMNYEYTKKQLLESKGMFANFTEFIDYCKTK